LIEKPVWWLKSVIPALGRLRQKDWEFKVSLGYLARACLKTNQATSKHYIYTERKREGGGS
jgi:hypothetical protein